MNLWLVWRLHNLLQKIFYLVFMHTFWSFDHRIQSLIILWADFPGYTLCKRCFWVFFFWWRWRRIVRITAFSLNWLFIVRFLFFHLLTLFDLGFYWLCTMIFIFRIAFTVIRTTWGFLWGLFLIFALGFALFLLLLFILPFFRCFRCVVWWLFWVFINFIIAWTWCLIELSLYFWFSQLI